MCYNPITIVNPTKYVSLRYRDRYLLQVPCGKCAACMTNKSNEWYYRLYHHSLDCYSKGGFVIFDTLTYDNAHLPHISDYLAVDKSVDFPCFSTENVRKFIVAFRQYCVRHLHTNFDYFLVSEYGTSSGHSHRPHHHVLFFVHDPIDPVCFSAGVAKYWKYGRTDGYPYKSGAYVRHNVFDCNSDSNIRSIKYITKYIQKSCKFQIEINRRIDLIMKSISNRFSYLPNWCESSHYWRVKEALNRRFNQFHRQSTFLGASALSKMCLKSIFDTGSLFIPDNENVIKKIPLPQYYKRKLFYALHLVDGALSWQPSQLGYKYLDYRLSVCVDNLANRLRALALHVNKVFDFGMLSDYILNYRGRFFADNPSTYYDRRKYLSCYNYSTRYDKEYFGKCGLSAKWCGNSSTGYMKRGLFVPIKDFVKKYVYLDEVLEEQIECLYFYALNIDSGKQKAFEVKQRLENLYHYIST